MKPHEDWQVLPHGDLEKLADNLYTVVGKLPMPIGETTRRMTIARLAGDRLLIYSAIALDDRRMVKLEALGIPAFLIVPSAIHRLDAKPWKLRYPQLQVIAPPSATDKVTEIVTVDTTSVDLIELQDPRVKIEVVPGTGGRELSMTVETATGRTLVVNDLIFNMPEMKGLAGWGLKLLGFGPGHATMPKLVRMRLVDDDEAVREQLRTWAAGGFERILVSHGAPIENPRETLLELARGLPA
jgi:hypothetical protein